MTCNSLKFTLLCLQYKEFNDKCDKGGGVNALWFINIHDNNTKEKTKENTKEKTKENTKENRKEKTNEKFLKL